MAPLEIDLVQSSFANVVPIPDAYGKEVAP
jgi:hypothetical protein